MGKKGPEHELKKYAMILKEGQMLLRYDSLNLYREWQVRRPRIKIWFDKEAF